MKVAKLVTVSVTTRVIVDENATDEGILEIAEPRLVQALEENGASEHFESIVDDKECPYGSITKDKDFDRLQRLGVRNYTLISQSVNIEGTFNPQRILPYFEEQLYVNEIDDVIDFLAWVHENDKMLGSRNYEKVFQEWKSVR